jgi:hypothetical protein
VNTHHPNTRIHLVAPRPRRCLHHRVWMASCTDCRVAHADLLENGGERPPSN